MDLVSLAPLIISCMKQRVGGDGEVPTICRVKVLDGKKVELCGGPRLPDGVEIDDPAILEAIFRMRECFYFDFAKIVFQGADYKISSDGLDLSNPSIIDLRLKAPELPKLSFPEVLNVDAVIGEPFSLSIRATEDGYVFEDITVDGLPDFINKDVLLNWMSEAKDFCRFLIASGAEGSFIAFLQFGHEGCEVSFLEEETIGVGQEGNDKLVIVRVGSEIRRFLADSHCSSRFLFGGREFFGRYFPEGTFDGENKNRPDVRIHFIGLD